jgi:hypothetical protein
MTEWAVADRPYSRATQTAVHEIDAALLRRRRDPSQTHLRQAATDDSLATAARRRSARTRKT